jgi:hypothetical protein
LIPGEDDFSCEGAEHNGRMLPTSKFIVLKRLLQKQRPQTQKTPDFNSQWKWILLPAN